jgi:ATP-binding cassette subfamily B protein
MLLSTSLTEAGYDVCEASSGKAALQSMQNQPFDIVLLDLVMPEMDGFQVLKQMKADHRVRDIPVVVVSGNEDMESVVRCLEMGAVDHLSKPFDPVLLHTRVRAAVALREFKAEELLHRAAIPPGEAQTALKPEEPGGAEDKIDKRMSTLGFMRFLVRTLVPCKKQTVFLVVLLLVSLAIEAVMPLGFKFITDDALLARNFQALILILSILVVGFLLVVLTELGSDLVFARLSTKVLNDLRYNMYRHLQRLSLGFYQRVSTGEIMSRFTTDFSAVESTVLVSLPIVLSESVMVVFGLVLLFVLEWKLALFAMVGLYVSYKSGRGVERPASGADANVKRGQAEIVAVLQESVGAQAVVKIFRLQNMVVERFKRQLADFSRTAARAAFLSYLTDRVPGRLVELFSLLTIGAGAVLTIYGYLTIGELIAFQVLLTSLVGSVQELTWSVPSLVRAAGGMNRIEQLLNEQPDVVDAADATLLACPSRDITLSDVTFGYAKGQTSLKNVSLTIPVNHSVLLVGSSGSGKSTVLNLLMRFYDPQQGSVAIDGHDLRTVQQDSLRQHMSVVLQENFLFNTTIRENIRLGKKGATDEEVETAAKAAQMHAVIMSFPKGYDTIVGERGSMLSGGQRQSLAIVRAVLSDPRILLLDEATSALDPAAASSIDDVLDQVGEGRTVIAVTHRLKSAPKADLIFVFKGGELIESGRHEELLERGRFYAQLWNKQRGFVLYEAGNRVEVDPQRLRNIPILSRLDEESLEAVAELLVTERYPKDRWIIQEGDSGDRLFIVVRGRVAVLQTEKLGQERCVAVLEDGAYFGEFARIRNVPSTAGVRTLCDCTLLSLAREHFLRLLIRRPSIQEEIERTLSERGALDAASELYAGRV